MKKWIVFLAILLSASLAYGQGIRVSSGIFDPASPGPIGGTIPAAGTFTTLSTTGASNVTQLTLKANASQTNSHPLLLFTNSSGTELFHLHSDNTVNLFMGYGSGNANTITGTGAEGLNNVFIGYESGMSNTKGQANVFVGYMAGYANTEGQMNTFLGMDAGKGTTTGQQLVIIGQDAGIANTIGSFGVLIGTDAAYKQTEGNYNVCVGVACLHENQTGNYNTAMGHAAGGGALTGGNSFSDNTLIGFEAGYALTGGTNTMLGSLAGYRTTSGASNVFLGYNAGSRQTTNSNLLIVDNQDRSTAAGEAAGALIYGLFNATATSQSITFNVGTSQFGPNAADSSAVTISLKGPDSSTATKAGGILNLRGGTAGAGGTNGAVTFGSTSAGSVTDDGRFLAASGLLGTPGYAFANATNTGFYLQSSSEVRFAINGVLSFDFQQGYLAMYGANPYISLGNSGEVKLYTAAANTLQLGLSTGDASAVTQIIQANASTTASKNGAILKLAGGQPGSGGTQGAVQIQNKGITWLFPDTCTNDQELKVAVSGSTYTITCYTP